MQDLSLIRSMLFPQSRPDCFAKGRRVQGGRGGAGLEEGRRPAREAIRQTRG